MGYLSNEFLQQFKSPKWGPIGEIIYLRTYSRWNEQNQRRETWDETLNRVVNYSLDLHKGNTLDLEQEAQGLFSLWWNLKAFPAGRTLWIGGTDYSKNNGFGNFNCSYLNIEKPRDFYDLTYLLMNGCGVGFGVKRNNIISLNNNFPLTDKDVKMKIDPYEYVGSPSTIEHTQIDKTQRTTYITVGDSRTGWAEAIKFFIEAFTTDPTSNIVINTNRVRPLGTPLQTFGGLASGPQPLIDFFEHTHRILSYQPRKWSSKKVLDICNLIGKTIVAGGARRSALIALGDSSDREYVTAKTGNWMQEAPWRTQSNNSIMFWEKPTQEELTGVFESILQYGEPGFVNARNASARHNNFQGLNPCGEILLDSYSLCNLTTINLMSFIRGTKQLDWNQLENAIRLQSRHNLRITNIDLEFNHWDKVQKRDRLLGMSITGLGDLIDHLSLSEAQQRKLFKWMHETARDESNSYADLMGVPRPLLSTTIKPEGSITQLPGASSGIHPNFGPYYIRRIRISEVDAVAQTLKDLGYPWEYDEFNHNTLVFSFPISTPATKCAYEYSAIEMLERYKLSMQHYVEHNTSITVYFEESEVPGIVSWLLENWDDYVAVSFLPKKNDSYPQMPYESIDKQQYESMMTDFPVFDRAALESIEGEKMQATDDLEAACSGNSCPIR